MPDLQSSRIHLVPSQGQRTAIRQDQRSIGLPLKQLAEFDEIFPLLAKNSGLALMIGSVSSWD
jgi:hypothetical protein